MKRFILTVFILTALVFAVYSQTGVVRELTGEVQLKRGNSSNFIHAQPGSQVDQDTIVSTGFRSTAIIEIGSTIITVRPLTQLSIAGIHRSADSEALNVNLQAGRVRLDVNPPAGARANASVRTPSATASVRGTSFEMDTRNLRVTSGNVNWRGSNGFSATVTVGFSSSVSNSGVAADPVQVTSAEFSPTVPVGFGVSGESTVITKPSDIGDVDLGVGW